MEDKLNKWVEVWIKERGFFISIARSSTLEQNQGSVDRTNKRTADCATAIFNAVMDVCESKEMSTAEIVVAINMVADSLGGSFLEEAGHLDEKFNPEEVMDALKAVEGVGPDRLVRAFGQFRKSQEDKAEPPPKPETDPIYFPPMKGEQ